MNLCGSYFFLAPSSEGPRLGLRSSSPGRRCQDIRELGLEGKVFGGWVLDLEIVLRLKHNSNNNHNHNHNHHNHHNSNNENDIDNAIE